MLIRIRETGAILSEQEFKDLHPHTVFSSVLTVDTLDHFGADPLLPGPQPTGESWQSATQDGAEEVGGKWYTKYKLVPTFTDPEEQAAYVAAWNAANLKSMTPGDISDRQFFEALSDRGYITYAEALAAVMTGTIPSQMEGFLAMLESYDPTGAGKARLAISGATTFSRSHWTVPIFASMYGMTEEQIDDLWRYASTL